jgi:hypothetical protein
MQRTITDYYSHEFQMEEQIIVANFKTKTATEYRVYFYPAKDYFDNIPEGSKIYEKGYHFGFTKVGEHESRVEPVDFLIGNTIANIAKEFFELYGLDNILIFHCDNSDGKKEKRLRTFDAWYRCGPHDGCFKKYDEEIIVNEEIDGQVVSDKEYLSLIIKCDHGYEDQILDEFQQLKDKMILEKQ